jgi:biotin carboxyl carrier protein
MVKKLLVCAVLAAGASLTWFVTAASAHHPEVTAVNVCAEGVPSIDVTATAWQTSLGEDHRVDHLVRIDVTGDGTNLTASGAFGPPSYAITARFAVPQAVGKTLHVRATSVAPWGPNEQYGSAGEFRETTVTVAGPCTPPSTTTTTLPSATAPPPSTAAPPVATTAPPVPDATEVEGRTEVRAEVPGTVTATELAFTGGDVTARVVAGTALFAAGLLLAWGASRRTT